MSHIVVGIRRSELVPWDKAVRAFYRLEVALSRQEIERAESAYTDLLVGGWKFFATPAPRSHSG